MVVQYYRSSFHQTSAFAKRPIFYLSEKHKGGEGEEGSNYTSHNGFMSWTIYCLGLLDTAFRSAVPKKGQRAIFFWRVYAEDRERRGGRKKAAASFCSRSRPTGATNKRGDFFAGMSEKLSPPGAGSSAERRQGQKTAAAPLLHILPHIKWGDKKGNKVSDARVAHVEFHASSLFFPYRFRRDVSRHDTSLKRLFSQSACSEAD